MSDEASNHYESAFESWLIENHIQYLHIDESKRAVFKNAKIKSFDFVLYLHNSKIALVEVKGRTFKGTSLEKMSGFECWVTTEDIEGLVYWQKIFGRNHGVFFVFAYKVEKIDVDFNGRDAFTYRQDRYLFFAVRLDDYQKFMKQRSPKWKTVTLPADKFRKIAAPAHNYLY